MKENIIKKAIIVLAICIIMIIIAIIYISSSEEVEENNLKETEESVEEEITFESQMDEYDFLVATNCISSYLTGVNKNSSTFYGYDEDNNYTIVIPQEQINQSVYNLLDEAYIEENAITLDNVYDFVLDVSEYLMFVPIDMKAQKDGSINTFAIYGYTIDLDYNLLEYIYVIVNVDEVNKTFSIRPIDSDTYNQDLEKSELSIEENDNNKINSLRLTVEYKVKQYFQIYKSMLLSNVDIAYEFLDSTYREKCFGNLENFKEYVSNNRDRIFTSTLNSYDANVEDNYIEYIEKDEDERYYIFNISNTDSSNFTVMLDTYVVGTTELQEEYSNSNDQEKVAINAMRFIYAINENNYYYAYNILDETFKNNNFSTQQEFEEYVEEAFFENNTIESGSFSEEGSYYIYNLTISDDSGNIKDLTIVMQLGEGTDFVMSFSIE